MGFCLTSRKITRLSCTFRILQHWVTTDTTCDTQQVAVMSKKARKVLNSRAKKCTSEHVFRRCTPLVPKIPKMQ